MGTHPIGWQDVIFSDVNSTTLYQNYVTVIGGQAWLVLENPLPAMNYAIEKTASSGFSPSYYKGFIAYAVEGVSNRQSKVWFIT